MQVFIYFNLNKKCWSIRAMAGPQRGKVLHHAKAWSLENAFFKVSEASRQRVLREKCKNVHAGVTGRLTAWWGLDGLPGLIGGDAIARANCQEERRAVTYNPYKGPTFIERATGHPVTSARWVVAEDCSPVVFAW